MTSDAATAHGAAAPVTDRAYVWTWLPDRVEPVVAGALDAVGDRLDFVYGRSYLARPDAVPLFLPELPLRPGSQRPADGLDLPGCLADAAPDAWGRRIILHRLHSAGASADPAVLPTLTYLLASSTDRIGAHDFQASADVHIPRGTDGSLEEILHAADRLQAGEPFSPEVDAVLNAGSSVGGARPKALVRDGDGRALIAKFDTPTDHYPVVRAEAVAMELARHVGLDVAATSTTRVLGRDVLLVERFDRSVDPADGGERRHAIVSALTLLGLHEMHARYATYPELADVVRARFERPEATLHELFARLVFNVLIGNRDDHARNHAAHWDGVRLTLTPAYDLCPQPRDTGEATQAMAIGRDGDRRAQLTVCLAAAPDFLLDPADARTEIDRQLTVVHERWRHAADAVGLTAADRGLLWRRALVHPYALEGYDHPR